MILFDFITFMIMLMLQNDCSKYFRINRVLRNLEKDKLYLKCHDKCIKIEKDTSNIIKAKTTLLKLYKFA